MSTAPKKPTSTKRRSTDADTVRDLLTWLRRNHVAVSRVRVGDVELDGLIDTSRVGPAVSEMLANGSGAADLRRQFGGAAIDRLERDNKDGPDGDYPVVSEPDDD